ncbi:MAG TPA: hypothetical protein DFJ59_07275 [Alphaproteobacteria bacterium]|nr:hypothetical protein [Alphaproteobacteria bacterium]
MRRISEQIRALDGLYRDGHVTSAERAAAWQSLFPAGIRVWDGRLLWVLSALCLALTLFSVAALNLTLILQFFEAQLEWLTRRWFDVLRWSSLIHVALASLPLLLFAVMAAREPRAWVQQILLVLTMALVALPVIVTGQIYQVGANASGLFLVWGLLALPVAVAARTKVAWVFIQALAYLFVLYQFREVFAFSPLIQSAVALAGLGLWALMGRSGAEWVRGRWYPAVNLLALGGMAAVSVFGPTSAALATLLVSVIAYGLIIWRSGLRTVLGGLSYILIVSLIAYFFLRYTAFDFIGDNILSGGFLLSLVVLLWFVGAIALYLRLRQRAGSAVNQDQVTAADRGNG